MYKTQREAAGSKHCSLLQASKPIVAQRTAQPKLRGSAAELIYMTRQAPPDGPRFSSCPAAPSRRAMVLRSFSHLMRTCAHAQARLLIITSSLVRRVQVLRAGGKQHSPVLDAAGRTRGLDVAAL
jgi:hypothetical protein